MHSWGYKYGLKKSFNWKSLLSFCVCLSIQTLRSTHQQLHLLRPQEITEAIYREMMRMEVGGPTVGIIFGHIEGDEKIKKFLKKDHE